MFRNIENTLRKLTKPPWKKFIDRDAKDKEIGFKGSLRKLKLMELLQIFVRNKKKEMNLKDKIHF